MMENDVLTMRICKGIIGSKLGFCDIITIRAVQEGSSRSRHGWPWWAV